jgi:hypothetical protein
MEFANGEFAALARSAPEQESGQELESGKETALNQETEQEREPEFTTVKSAGTGHRPARIHAFFPGCQLGAADPRYVTEPYRWLLSKKRDTGLLLRCCGVPAEWAGNEKLHESAIDGLREDWNGWQAGSDLRLSRLQKASRGIPA